MAASIGRICGARLFKLNTAKILNQGNRFSTTREWTKSKKVLLATLGVLAGGTGTLLFALDQSVKALELELHPPAMPWTHDTILGSLDHESVRRGYEVYKNVCSACHSLRFVTYNNLVGVTHTEAEAKAEAAEIMVTDGPNDLGEMFQRPGKLFDRFPNPYPNEEAAAAANNGAAPPDLTYIALATEEGLDYVFSLLLGFCEPPAGVELKEIHHFNPYFMGGAISMAPPLYDEVIEYSDGTPATASQLAKDVCSFLKWTSEPEHDTRKLMLIKGMFILTILNVVAWYYKRHKWTVIKSRKILFNPKKKTA